MQRVLSSLLSVSFVAVAIAACSAPNPPLAAVGACIDAGGLCVTAGTCVPGGGTVSSGPSDCYSDSGPSECCLGAKPAAGATTCAGLGGVCVAQLDCVSGHGYLTVKDEDCGGRADVACCVPHAVCGDVKIACCAPKGSYPVSCDEGKQVCTVGTLDVSGMCPNP